MVTQSGWKYRFIQLVADKYSVAEVMDILNLDDEYVIKNCLKETLLKNPDAFLDDLEESEGE